MLRQPLMPAAAAAVGLLLSAGAPLMRAQRPALSDAEKSIAERISKLRATPDGQRGAVTKELAADIGRLPAAPIKAMLAAGLANLSTEGDFGHETLQEVADTLAAALRELPSAPSNMYEELASLVRYEHVKTACDAPKFTAAMAKLQAEDERRQNADFTLTDLQGKPWTLKDLRGKVVLVNFWATWCPPCRKEMPDLEKLYGEFKDKGLVVLAISDEDMGKVKPFIAEKAYTYPILLDPGRKVNQIFGVEGIPKSFVYDREGKLVAQSIDMRTRGQFLEMLSAAGIR